MPDHHLSEDSVTRSAEAFLRVGDVGEGRNLPESVESHLWNCKRQSTSRFSGHLSPRFPCTFDSHLGVRLRPATTPKSLRRAHRTSDAIKPCVAGLNTLTL
jgi:hypothetical protein